jgi:hypothetical protein
MYGSRIVKRLPALAPTAIALAAGLLLLWAFYLGVVLNIPYDADAGGLMLMARTALDGNVLLRGWIVTTQYYLTTELPFYIAGILILGFTWKVIYVVTALHYAAIALLAIVLSTGGGLRPSALHRIIIPLALTAYLAAWAFNHLYLSTGHLVCFAYFLLCLLCIQRVERTGSWIYYLIYASFLAFAMIGDIFALYLIAIPVTLVCLVRILARAPRSAA